MTVNKQALIAQSHASLDALVADATAVIDAQLTSEYVVGATVAVTFVGVDDAAVREVLVQQYRAQGWVVGYVEDIHYVASLTFT